MPGLSELRAGAPESPLLDRLARASAAGVSRRRVIGMAAGAGAAAMMPRLSWPTRARGDVKVRGTCPDTAAQGTCYGNTTPWTPGCKKTIPSGKASTWNGCGPEAGLDFPGLGHGDFVPDQPFDLGNFFSACQAHDCCYGTCQSSKAQCDKNFLSGMSAECLARWGDAKSGVFGNTRLLLCLQVATAYYAAVGMTSTGTAAYNEAQSVACLCCEEECGPGIDTQTDPKNCGQCGHECPSGWQCCSGICVELSSSPENCGRCGNRCNTGDSCVNGQCQFCPDGQTQCGQSCCQPGQQCVNGECVSPCAAGEVECNGQCCQSGLSCCNGTCEPLWGGECCNGVGDDPCYQWPSNAPICCHAPQRCKPNFDGWFGHSGCA